MNLIVRILGSDRANGRVSETLGKAAQGSVSLGRVRLSNIRASSKCCVIGGFGQKLFRCLQNTYCKIKIIFEISGIEKKEEGEREDKIISNHILIVF